MSMSSDSGSDVRNNRELWNVARIKEKSRNDQKAEHLRAEKEMERNIKEVAMAMAEDERKRNEEIQNLLGNARDEVGDARNEIGAPLLENKVSETTPEAGDDEEDEKQLNRALEASLAPSMNATSDNLELALEASKKQIQPVNFSEIIEKCIDVKKVGWSLSLYKTALAEIENAIQDQLGHVENGNSTTVLGIESSKVVRKGNRASTQTMYGRIESEAMLKIAKKVNLKSNETFLDIGHGIGVSSTVLLAFIIGCNTIGIEMEADRFRVGECFTENMQQLNDMFDEPVSIGDIKHVNSDAKSYDLSALTSADVIFANNFNGVYGNGVETIGRSLDDHVLSIFAQSKAGARLVLLDKSSSIGHAHKEVLEGLDKGISSKLTKTQAADASWFDYEEMTLHQPNVSWMKEEGGKSIQCYIYTKREQVEPVPIENGLGHVHPSVYCEPKAIMCKRESCSGSKDASYVLKADSPGGRLMICNQCAFCNQTRKNLRNRSKGKGSVNESEEAKSTPSPSKTKKQRAKNKDKAKAGSASSKSSTKSSFSKSSTAKSSIAKKKKKKKAETVTTKVKPAKTKVAQSSRKKQEDAMNLRRIDRRTLELEDENETLKKQKADLFKTLELIDKNIAKGLKEYEMLRKEKKTIEAASKASSFKGKGNEYDELFASNAYLYQNDSDDDSIGDVDAEDTEWVETDVDPTDFGFPSDWIVQKYVHVSSDRSVKYKVHSPPPDSWTFETLKLTRAHLESLGLGSEKKQKRSFFGRKSASEEGTVECDPATFGFPSEGWKIIRRTNGSQRSLPNDPQYVYNVTAPNSSNYTNLKKAHDHLKEVNPNFMVNNNEGFPSDWILVRFPHRGANGVDYYAPNGRKFRTIEKAKEYLQKVDDDSSDSDDSSDGELEDEVANDRFPPNWEVTRIIRSNKNRVYVRAPDGKIFNSMVKARKYLKEVGANPALSALKPTPPPQKPSETDDGGLPSNWKIHKYPGGGLCVTAPTGECFNSIKRAKAAYDQAFGWGGQQQPPNSTKRKRDATQNPSSTSSESSGSCNAPVCPEGKVHLGDLCDWFNVPKRKDPTKKEGADSFNWAFVRIALKNSINPEAYKLLKSDKSGGGKWLFAEGSNDLVDVKRLLVKLGGVDPDPEKEHSGQQERTIKRPKAADVIHLAPNPQPPVPTMVRPRVIVENDSDSESDSDNDDDDSMSI